MVLRHQDPKVERLRAIPFFADADDQALQHLLSAADEVRVKAGHDLIDEGHHYGEAYVVVSGTIGVRVGGDEVAEIGPGELIGELALLTHDVVSSATVVAKTDADLLVIPYNRFDQILDDNPALVRAIATQLVHRLRAMDVLYRTS
ncbi:MAG: cyclic nucleotide-binding domain-containing protein [Acidimicrobiales bacterium]